MRIGIIGAESSHSTSYARTINNEKAFSGIEVTSIWGETAELAKKTADMACIKNIVADPKEMLHQVDAVIIAHRNGSKHLAVAEYFLKNKVPMFIDKPLCCKADEAADFLNRCENAGVPVTSFSSSPLQKQFIQFKNKLAECGKIYFVSILGWADYQSIYDGLFFYGYHHVELCQSLMGLDLLSIKGDLNGNHFVGHLNYAQSRSAQLSMSQETKGKPFGISVYTEKGLLSCELKDDESPYLENMKIFIEMFKTGKSTLNRQKLVQAIHIVETLQQLANSQSKR